MEQQYQRRKQANEPEPVSDRLHHLTSDSADRILRRAVELHHDSEYDDVPLDRAKLEAIANELGIGVEFVEQALVEELSRPETDMPSSLADRLFHPEQLTDRSIANGAGHEVGRDIATWMTKHEGLKPMRSVAGGTVWEHDPSPLSSIRSGLKISQGTGVLKSTGPITSRVERVDDDRHVVTVTADVSVSRKVAAAGAAVGTIAGSIIGGTFLATVGVLEGALIAAAIAGTSFGIAVASTKAWAHQVRKGLRHALWGITERTPDVHGETTGIAKFFRFVEDVIDTRTQMKR